MSLNLFVRHLAIRLLKCFCGFSVAGQSLGEEADGAGRFQFLLQPFPSAWSERGRPCCAKGLTCCDGGGDNGQAQLPVPASV